MVNFICERKDGVVCQYAHVRVCVYVCVYVCVCVCEQR